MNTFDENPMPDQSLVLLARLICTSTESIVRLIRIVKQVIISIPITVALSSNNFSRAFYSSTVV